MDINVCLLEADELTMAVNDGVTAELSSHGAFINKNAKNICFVTVAEYNSTYGGFEVSEPEDAQAVQETINDGYSCYIADGNFYYTVVEVRRMQGNNSWIYFICVEAQGQDIISFISQKTVTHVTNTYETEVTKGKYFKTNEPKRETKGFTKRRFKLK